MKAVLDAGRLGPDDLIVQMISERVSQPDCGNGYLLDGFPRTMGQAEELEKMTDIDLVLNIVVDFEVLVERAVGRRICPKDSSVYHVKFNPSKTTGVCDRCGGPLIQRDDDKEATVRNRLKVYQDQTAPLVDHYRKKGKLVDIDGSGGIDAVQTQMVKAIDGLKK
jgi:adenylate kinase